MEQRRRPCSILQKILIAETVPLPGEKRAAGQEAGAGGAGRQAGPKDSERKRVEIGEVEYVVDVVTSDIRGAGTDANVFVMLFGPKGSTTVRARDVASSVRLVGASS